MDFSHTAIGNLHTLTRAATIPPYGVVGLIGTAGPDGVGDGGLIVGMRPFCTSGAGVESAGTGPVGLVGPTGVICCVGIFCTVVVVVVVALVPP